MVPKDCGIYFTSSWTGYFFEIGTNLKYAQLLAEKGFIRSETVKRASQALNDPLVSYQHKKEYFYLIGFEFAGYALNNFWRLRPYLENKVNKFVYEKFSQNFIIGFQLRVEFLSNEDLRAFFRCANFIETYYKDIIGNRTVKWFISSDDEKAIRNILNEYGGKILVADGKIGHVAEDFDSYERALIDIELLSRCDQLILTGGSTFGFIASIKSQKIPFYVEGKSEMTMCEIFRFYAPSRNHRGDAVF